MSEIKLFDEKYIEEHLSMIDCINLMDKTLREEHKGEYIQFMRTVHKIPGENVFGFMPAYGFNGYFGAKVLCGFGKNYLDGYPSHQGQVMVFENTHGCLVALADADTITKIRTAAASGAATRALANKNAKILTIFGTGAEAVTHLQAMEAIYNKFDEVRIFSRSLEKAQAFCNNNKANSPLVAYDSAQKAVENADIICTVTSAREPLFKYEWLKKGVHINAVGSCSTTARELDSLTVKNARFFGDKKESVFKEGGDFVIPLNEGTISENHYLGDLAEVLENEVAGRTSETDITIYESLGIAVEDLASAVYLYTNS